MSNAIAHARQEAAHRQKLLDEHTARACQEAAAACARVSNAIARARQEATRHQKLLNKQAAVRTKAAINKATEQLCRVGDFNANFGSTDLFGACNFYFSLGIRKGKLPYLLGDAVSVVIHEGIIFSLPPTL